MRSYLDHRSRGLLASAVSKQNACPVMGLTAIPPISWKARY
jgi:hypothetical protein